MLQLHALGSRIEVQGKGAERAAAEITRYEALLTRFRPSPLTKLNSRGVLYQPDIDLVDAVGHALHVARQTGGLVTPAVLPALEAAGYAGTLGERRGRPAAVPDTTGVICSPVLIRLPPGVRLDLGGTAKSWIAEKAFAHLTGDGYVNAGGDLYTRQSLPFAVEILRPFGGEPLFLECPAGTWGVATSSTLKRAWEGGHHLIDPRTALPLESRFVQVTVIAARLTAAEVLTKLAFLDTELLDKEMLLDTEKLSASQQQDAQAYAFDRNGHFWARAKGEWLKVPDSDPDSD